MYFFLETHFGECGSFWGYLHVRSQESELRTQEEEINRGVRSPNNVYTHMKNSFPPSCPLVAMKTIPTYTG